MISRFYKCCKCEHEFDSDQFGSIYILTDSEAGIVEQSDTNKCPNCGSTDIAYLTGDDDLRDLYNNDN